MAQDLRARKWRQPKLIVVLLSMIVIRCIVLTVELTSIKSRVQQFPTDSKEALTVTLNSSQFHVQRFPIDSKEADGSKGPVLLEGWNKFNDSNWKAEYLMSVIGKYPQYLKDTAVQPVLNARTKKTCVLPGEVIAQHFPTHQLLFFTNNHENEAFMRKLSNDYTPPSLVEHIDDIKVFSIVPQDISHPFHTHGESWLGQLEGRRMWWFLPLDAERPKKVNACHYLTGVEPVPHGATSILQSAGEVIWFPKDLLHATCALDKWTVGIGAQKGPLIRQKFSKLDPNKLFSKDDIASTLKDCLGAVPTKTIEGSRTVIDTNEIVD